MGKVLSFINSRKITPFIRFLKDYLNWEKIEILNLLNEDFLVNKELFCSFFSTTENYFNFFDNEETGLINLWEIFIMIFLFKADTFKKKIQNILKSFSLTSINLQNDQQNYLKDKTQKKANLNVTIDEINFISETFLNVLLRLFFDKLIDDEQTIFSLKECINNYIFEIFEMDQKNLEEIKLVKLIK